MDHCFRSRMGVALAVSLALWASGASAQEVVDSREASFLPPPASLLPVEPVTMEPKTAAEPAAEAQAPSAEKDGKKEEAKKTEKVPEKDEKAEKKEAPAAKPVKKEPEKKVEDKKEEKKEEIKKEEVKKTEEKPAAVAPSVVAPAASAAPTPSAAVPPAAIKEKKEPVAKEAKGDALEGVQPVIVSAPEKPVEAEPPVAPAPAAPVAAPAPMPAAAPAAAAPAAAAPEKTEAAVDEKAVEEKKTAPAPPKTEAIEAVPLPVPVAAAPAPAPAPTKPARVAAAPLADNDPDARGLWGAEAGGLGADLWKGTLRTTVDRLLPMIGLPTGSPALNELARRAFLSETLPPAPPPSGEKPARSLIAQRIEGLVALGAVPEAWQLAGLVDPQSIDSVTLRQLAEAAMISGDRDAVCPRVIQMMETHGKTEEGKVEWQKAWILCKLQAKDEKAVQLGLDMMREQQVKDDLFITLLNSNLLGGKKILPRQLTPLRPTSLAVLQQMENPLPSELFARPDAALIPALLEAKAMDDKARLDLAERAAARGLITPAQLKTAYESVKLNEAEIATINNSAERGSRPRAILYQAMVNENAPAKKIALMQKYLADVPAAALCGAQGVLLAEVLETVPVTSDSNIFAAEAARIMALAARPDRAAVWLKLAREAASRSPTALAGLIRYWPAFTLSGLVPDGDYAAGMKAWLDGALNPVDTGDMAREIARERAETALLILSAAGYAVPEEAWQRVMEVAAPTKQLMPPPALLDRLRQASTAARKGETALLSLLLMGGTGGGEPAFAVKIEVIRALRLAGFASEAQSLARETLAGVE